MQPKTEKYSDRVRAHTDGDVHGGRVPRPAVVQELRQRGGVGSGTPAANPLPWAREVEGGLPGLRRMRMCGEFLAACGFETAEARAVGKWLLRKSTGAGAAGLRAGADEPRATSVSNRQGTDLSHRGPSTSVLPQSGLGVVVMCPYVGDPTCGSEKHGWIGTAICAARDNDTTQART